MPEWQSVYTAPFKKRVLVCGSGGIRIAIKDEWGNWRSAVGHVYTGALRFWMPLPEPPKDE